ncbi:MAG: hypothetical protein QXV17_06850 [Candidatus Micrarchaeaceae archaeon]
MSVSTQPKKRLGARIVRAFFVGLTIGLVGGLGVYFMALSVNLQSSSSILNPTALLILTVGFILSASLGTELSKDLAGE